MKEIEGLIDIVDQFKPGDTIVLHSALAEPAILGQQLGRLADRLDDVTVYCLMPMGEAGYGAAGAQSGLHVYTFLPGAGLRAAVNNGSATQEPVRLYDIAGYFANRKARVDWLFLQLSCPDADGNCSLGLSVDYMLSLLEQKPTIVAELNEQMPVTCGETEISHSLIDYALRVDYSPQTMPSGKADEIDRQVAAHVVDLLTDRQVIQYGIGTIPELVLSQVSHLKNLSIHTGLITDAVMAAMDSGAFDNSGHPDHPGKIVAAMAGGSAEFYRYLNHNDEILFRPTTYTHDRQVLRRIDGLVAINSVLQVDLLGTANAERAGGRTISGPGGLFDFARGASEAHKGLSILALRSVTRKGNKSCIVDMLDETAARTVTNEHLDYVVTEYGAAFVRGKKGAQIAEALIAIAHPDHRDRLSCAV